ncbi:winged helix-turn-helix transcriptional regulator [Umezawaea tangerina]|uniref:HxlR family transcriptional regulator n=1 Tax=Umezawaea tangerina TaxID=84725 RepID=A0A2T0T220_9PSEU|nr:helix-turn-helix domain-containing protein [Umezawaea tangerina]PRY39707.1 HxlR family transcriptional regulator [Umezawaea tangerina]
MSEPSGPPRDLFGADCPRLPIRADITGRWATLLLAALTTRPHRFAELAARLDGISEKVLSQTLRTLTRDGLVSRTATPTVPIQVTYELTPLGADLTPRLVDLVTWADRHGPAIQAARSAYDADPPIPPAVANRH